jgi:hypothetical protein
MKEETQSRRARRRGEGRCLSSSGSRQILRTSNSWRMRPSPSPPTGPRRGRVLLGQADRCPSVIIRGRFGSVLYGCNYPTPVRFRLHALSESIFRRPRHQPACPCLDLGSNFACLTGTSWRSCSIGRGAARRGMARLGNRAHVQSQNWSATSLSRSWRGDARPDVG